jgi:hypothetical protein
VQDIVARVVDEELDEFRWGCLADAILEIQRRQAEAVDTLRETLAAVDLPEISEAIDELDDDLDDIIATVRETLGLGL